MNSSQTTPLVKRWLMAGCCLMSFLVLLGSCTNVPPPGSPTHGPFKDFGYGPPPSEQYNGTLFKLSQDYPRQMPESDQLPLFFKTDFQKDWRNYMMQVRNYCFEGNIEVDWRVENNTVRRWYHMPWQDYGRAGREAIHGLTQEAPLAQWQLAATQNETAVAHAIGFYNEFGGYTIGQVWKDPTKPDPSVTSNQGFPIGTVVCKLLFVDMSPDLIAEQVPYLVNPIEWQAYTAVGFNPQPENQLHTPVPEKPRRVKEVTLIQMDIMIRDDRAPSGWIFGTFQYNGTLENTTPWNNLIPVGLMWGNDPDRTDDIPVTTDNRWPTPQPVSQTPINTSLEETIINPDASELPPTHLGWKGRLNGPVDNPLSSCMSCHMTASYTAEPLSPLFISPPKGTSPGTREWDTWWMQWFQNVGWKDGQLNKFMDANYSLDFSLQLSGALQNFDKSRTGETPEHPVQR